MWKIKKQFKNPPAFIRQLLELLLSWGLDPNISLGNSRRQHILLSLLELVNLVRNPSDLDYVHDLTLTLIQHGADVDVDIEGGFFYFS